MPDQIAITTETRVHCEQLLALFTGKRERERESCGLVGLVSVEKMKMEVCKDNGSNIVILFYSAHHPVAAALFSTLSMAIDWRSITPLQTAS